MEKTLSGVVIVSIVAIALPAWSQFSTTQGPIAPAECAGHPAPFQVRRAGLPGSKSGPTVTGYGTTALEGCTEAAKWRPEQGYRGFRAAKQARPSSLRTPPNKPDQGPGCGKAAANLASGAIHDPVSEGMSKLTSKSGELMSAADRGAGASA